MPVKWQHPDGKGVAFRHRAGRLTASCAWLKYGRDLRSRLNPAMSGTGCLSRRRDNEIHLPDIPAHQQGDCAVHHLIGAAHGVDLVDGVQHRAVIAYRRTRGRFPGATLPVSCLAMYMAFWRAVTLRLGMPKDTALNALRSRYEVEKGGLPFVPDSSTLPDDWRVQGKGHKTPVDKVLGRVRFRSGKLTSVSATGACRSLPP